MPQRLLSLVFAVAHLGYTIHGLVFPRRQWQRDVSEKNGKQDDRFGPWYVAHYDKHKLPREIPGKGGDCLYIVRASDGAYRYIGFSNKGFYQRWRTSPAIDAVTGVALERRSVFHNRCWRRIESELLAGHSFTYEVRVIYEQELAQLLRDRLAGTPLAAAVSSNKVSRDTEIWMRNFREKATGGIQGFLPWNLE
jgi:hypothetical protein